MSVVPITLFVTLAAGLIAGASLDTFLAAAVCAAIATWVTGLSYRPVRRLFITLDPLKPDPTVLLHALRTSLEEIHRTRHPVLLRISAFTPTDRPLFHLGLNRSGDLEACCERKRPLSLKHPGIWIPDHPVPLTLPHNRCVTLFLKPSEGGRVRASLASATPLPLGAWVATVLLVLMACALDLASLLSATLGFAFQAYLLTHHSNRTETDP